MLDFPNNPTGGQVFDNWVWDGTKWTSGVGSGTSYLPLAGGTRSASRRTIMASIFAAISATERS
jgi:hypothetical protein